MEISRNKERYKKYIDQRVGVPIFNKSFWLDAVCGESGWQVVIVIDDGSVVAAMPYFIKRKIVFDIVSIPKHTQRFSPCIDYPKKVKTYSQRVDFENKVVIKLLAAIPNKVFKQLNFHYDYDNVLPFNWSGYTVKHRHTYVIDDISSPEKVFEGFSNNRKRGVKRARKSVVVKEGMEASKFYSLHEESLKKKGRTISYSKEHFEKIYDACGTNKCGNIFYATDDDMNLHAALFVIWDEGAAYHLIPVVAPEFYKSQAISLIVVSAIQYLKDKTLSYDFDGSMTKNIERGYREYGPLPKIFFNISKINPKFLSCVFSG